MPENVALMLVNSQFDGAGQRALNCAIVARGPNEILLVFGANLGSHFGVIWITNYIILGSHFRMQQLGGAAASADLVKPFRLELGEHLEPNLPCTPCTTRRVGPYPQASPLPPAPHLEAGG